MEIRVLGPVEVSAGGRPVAIGAGKPRALLVMLAVHEGSTVSTDRLVEGLWGEEPPATAAKMVQLGVSQLRKALRARAAERRSSRAGAGMSCVSGTVGWMRDALSSWLRGGCHARGWRCGAARRWPTSRTSRSRSRRSAAWRSCA